MSWKGIGAGVGGISLASQTSSGQNALGGLTLAMFATAVIAAPSFALSYLWPDQLHTVGRNTFIGYCVLAALATAIGLLGGGSSAAFGRSLAVACLVLGAASFGAIWGALALTDTRAAVDRESADGHLPLSERTISEFAQSAGYQSVTEVLDCRHVTEVDDLDESPVFSIHEQTDVLGEPMTVEQANRRLAATSTCKVGWTKFRFDRSEGVPVDDVLRAHLLIGMAQWAVPAGVIALLGFGASLVINRRR